MKVFHDGTQEGRFFQLALLAAANFTAAYGRFTLGPLQEAVRLSLGLSDHQIAWLQGPALALPMALGSIPLGLLADRYSRRRLLLVGTVLNVTATILTALSAHFVQLFIARCLVGLASAALLIAVFSMLCDLYPPAQRGRALMMTSMGEIGGAPAAFMLGGVLLAMGNAVPNSFELESWRWALLWMGVPLLAAVVLMSLLREPPRTDIKVENLSVREAWPQLWRYRSVVFPVLLARIMVWLADGAVLVWAAPSFARRFALSPERIGAIMATALLVSGLLGPMLGGPLADWCQRRGGPRRTMTALCAIASLSIPAALFALMPNATLAGLMLGVFLTLGFITGTAALALATVVIPGELRGLYFAIAVTVGATFLIGLAPLVVSGLSSVLGGPGVIGNALAIVCAAASLLGALVFGFGRRYFPGAAPIVLVPAPQRLALPHDLRTKTQVLK